MFPIHYGKCNFPTAKRISLLFFIAHLQHFVIKYIDLHIATFALASGVQVVYKFLRLEIKPQTFGVSSVSYGHHNEMNFFITSLIHKPCLCSQKNQNADLRGELNFSWAQARKPFTPPYPFWHFSQGQDHFYSMMSAPFLFTFSLASMTIGQ